MIAHEPSKGKKSSKTKVLLKELEYIGPVKDGLFEGRVFCKGESGKIEQYIEMEKGCVLIEDSEGPFFRIKGRDFHNPFQDEGITVLNSEGLSGTHGLSGYADSPGLF